MKQNSNQNEIDLQHLLTFIIKEKILIIIFTGFITLASAIYVRSLAPTYLATTSFISPSEQTVFHLNTLQFLDESKQSIQGKFLAKLINQDTRKKVYFDGDYSIGVNTETEKKEEDERFSAFTSSIKILPPGVNEREEYLLQLSPTLYGLRNLVEIPYIISMQGSNSEAIFKYLNELLNTANTQTINNLISINKSMIRNRKDELSAEIDFILDLDKQKLKLKIKRLQEEDLIKIREINYQIERVKLAGRLRLKNEIALLTQSSKLAKVTGIIDNNFNNQIVKNIKIEINDGAELPIWYQYGEVALLEKISLLKNRLNDDDYLYGLIDLKKELHQTENNVYLQLLEEGQDDIKLTDKIINLYAEINRLDLNGKDLQLSLPTLNAAQFTSNINISVIKQNKGRFVFLAFVVSFIISILVTLLRYALRQVKNTLPS